MKQLFFVACILFGLGASAQNRVSIKGHMIDTSAAPLAFSTVMLLTPKDSALVSYARADEKGHFEMKNIKRGDYIFKASYVGFLPIQIVFSTTDGTTTDLGTVKMKPISKELFEVVVRTAKAPLNIRGDTIEYNARSFKVPPGSTVEDLLRKLPGFQIDQDGSIRAQGQEVKRVTVDGKNFFGGDPKTATKNLSAESIDKVQVFNGQSEQAQLTGVADGKREKTVNLELKEEFKKGGFGKIKAGAGTDGRADVRGNYNKFDEKRQFSVIGFGNNVNQTGLSWDDRQDFYGSSSFQGDDIDFGFGGGINSGGFQDDGSGFYSNGRGSFWFNNGGDQGINQTVAGGANYNFDTKKKKLNANYYATQKKTWIDQLSRQETFLSDGTFANDATNNNFANNLNHRLQFRYEANPDSSNTFIVIGNGSLNNRNSTDRSEQTFTRQDILNSRTSLNNTANVRGYRATTTALYRHKFKQKGKNFSTALSYSLNDNDSEADQQSTNRFLRPNGSTAFTNQFFWNNNNLNSSEQVKTSMFFIQPLGKRFFWETFMNFGVRNSTVTLDVRNRLAGDVRSDSLSRYFTNRIQHRRLGSSLRYNNKGFSLNAGVVGVSLDLSGQFASSPNSLAFGRVGKRYNVVVPQLGMNYDMKNNRYLWIDYSPEVNQPSISDLQPVINVANPRFIQQGNPNLSPHIEHNIYMGYSHFNPANFSRLFLNGGYTYNVNQVVYNQSVDSLLITRTKPTNVTGGGNYSGYVNFGFPIVKTKSSIGFETNFNGGKSFISVNDVLNTTKNISFRVGGNLDLTPAEWFSLYLNTNFTFGQTRYSINTAQNQNTLNRMVSLQSNVKFPKEVYFNVSFNYNGYKNDRFGFDQHIPMLNASVYKIMGKAKKSEIRLSGYDILRQNLGVNQFGSQNFFSTTETRVITRYFMLTYTYNMRGVTGKVRKDSWW